MSRHPLSVARENAPGRLNTIGAKLFAAGAGLAALLGVTLSAAAASEKVGPYDMNWEERIMVASGEAYQGPWRMNESDFRYVDDPSVAFVEGGAVAVAWVDQARKDIFFQVYTQEGKARFEKRVNISRSPEIFSWLPRIASAAGDPSRVYILWQEIVFSGGTHGGEIFFARSSDGGRSFSEPMNLSNTIAGAGKGRLTRDYWHNGSLDLTLSPEGNLYAAWTEYEGALRFSRSTDGGESFSLPIRVGGTGDSLPARGPSLTAGAGGTVYLAWTVGEDKSADIRFATSADHGRSFGEPQIVARSRGHADAPKIAVDSKGTVHLVFAESPAGPLKSYHIRYTRLRGGERAFEEPRKIAEAAKRRGSANFPGLSLDGEDRLYVIWELFPEPTSYAQGLGFTYSGNGGQTFVPAAAIPGSGERALGSSGGRQGLLMRKLAVNAAGEIAVVHSTFNQGNSSQIWLIRGKVGQRLRRCGGNPRQASQPDSL